MAAAMVRLRMAPQPLRAALIDLALQADMSIGGDLDSCRGAAPGLSGRMGVVDALTRLLGDSACAFTLADKRTIVIRRRLSPVEMSPRLPAPPQSTPKAAEAAVTEVVVTGLHTPDLPGRLPYAVSAIPATDLTRSGASSLQDLAGQVAGMTVTNLGPGRDKVILRGMSDGIFTGQTQSTVALYLDNVPITYNAPDPDLRLADVDRVEVMRGPQGTLFGGGSIGGVVRIVTRQPDFDLRSANLSAGLAATAHGGLGYDAEGMVNLAIVPGRLAARFVAYEDMQPGFIDNPALGRDGVNRSRRDGARLSVRAAVTPDWSLAAGLTHQSINSEDTQYGFARLGPRTRDIRLAEPHDNDFDQASATLTGTGAWGRFSLSTARLGHKFDSRYDASSMISAFGGVGAGAPFDERRTIDLAVTEAVYATPAQWRLSGLIGGFFSAGEGHLQTSLTGAGAGRLYAEDRTDKINEAAVYGETTFDISPKLAVTAGLRWFDFQLAARSRVDQPAGARLLDAHGEASGFSPKALVSYANAGTLFYLQAAEGYRPGGFNSAVLIGQAFDTPGAPPRRYKSDELWNYEAGFKTRWFDDRLQVRLAAYFAVWDDIQSDQYTPQGLGYTANIGAGDNRGVELEATVRVSEALELRTALIANKPEITRPDPGVRSADDASLPGIARESASFAAEYHRTIGEGAVLRLGASMLYVGRSTLNFDGLRSQTMGDYLTAGVQSAIETERWSLRFAVDNLFDKTSNTFSFGNPFLIGQEAIITPLRPRTATLRLMRRF